MDSFQDMIAAQRGELAAVLSGLPAGRWDAPTLCAGWRVREVVAHITMPFRYSAPRVLRELARSRGKFNEMADRVARRDAASLSPAELAEAVRSSIGHPWKPPGGGFEGALSHDMIRSVLYHAHEPAGLLELPLALRRGGHPHARRRNSHCPLLQRPQPRRATCR